MAWPSPPGEALVTDVGKIGIPDRLLQKPGRLDDKVMRIMRTHARRGHDVLASIADDQIAAVATVVLHHHEAVDGNGYSDSLRSLTASRAARDRLDLLRRQSLAVRCPAPDK